MANTTEASVEAPATAEQPLISHWIDGAESPSTSGRTAPIYNPATGARTAQIALADRVWSTFSIAKRQAVVFAFRELLNARKGSSRRSSRPSTARSFRTRSVRSTAGRRSSSSRPGSRT